MGLEEKKPDEIQCKTFDDAPDKCWAAAKKFAALANRPPRTADNWIMRTYRFQKALQNNTDPAQEMRASKWWPDIYGATAIYLNTSSTDRRKRIVECGVLARKDNGFIAKELCVNEDVIAAYVALFFNIRKILDNQSAICGSILSRFMEYGDKDNMFYALAYFFGWNVFYAYTLGGSTAEVDTWIRITTNRNHRINALTASSTIDPTNPLNAEVLYNVTTHMDLMEDKDRDRRTAGGIALGETKDNLQVLLNSAPTNIMQLKGLQADEARVLPGAAEGEYVEAEKPEPIEHGKAKQS
jgi:hypothetical protein